MSTDTCRAEVWSAGAFRPHTCGRRGVVERDGLFWCRQHDPEAVNARRESANARYQAQMDQKSRHWAIERCARNALDAIVKIADGHNDPRSLALDVLKEHPDRKPSGDPA